VRDRPIQIGSSFIWKAVVDARLPRLEVVGVSSAAAVREDRAHFHLHVVVPPIHLFVAQTRIRLQSTMHF